MGSEMCIRDRLMANISSSSYINSESSSPDNINSNTDFSSIYNYIVNDTAVIAAVSDLRLNSEIFILR